ncbi:MAG: hypothetical protein JJE25_01625, partial [Bacteroidia bacterium]|nr:hypothetical protein [Bacteroidia bacterium]
SLDLGVTYQGINIGYSVGHYNTIDLYNCNPGPDEGHPRNPPIHEPECQFCFGQFNQGEGFIPLVWTVTNMCGFSTAQYSFTAGADWWWDWPINAITTPDIWTASSNPFHPGSSVIKFSGDLHIPAGADITIDNMTFEFDANSKVIVEAGTSTIPGGKLTLRGTTFTGNVGCQNMWQGVEVHGTGQTGQPWQSNQGQFFMMKSGNTHSTIAQAIYGVFNMDFTTFDQSTRGGYFNCDDAVFENNLLSIGMDSHNYNSSGPGAYRCEIKDCTFKKTGNGLWSPYAGDRPEMFVFLYDVTGNDIKFTNSVSLSNTFTDGKTGIFCWDVSNVNLDKATFTSCDYGINSQVAFSSNPTTHTFTNLVFDNCHTGISLTNTRNDVITNNLFNPYFGSKDDNFYGIYLDKAQNFHITGNTFTKYSYGIVCNNSTTGGGLINLDNHFNICWRGIQTSGDNKNLTIRCNVFDNTSNSGSVFSTHWYIAGDLPNQGSSVGGPDAPAGNEFHHNAGFADLYCADQAVPSYLGLYNFCYFYHDNCSQCAPWIYITLPNTPPYAWVTSFNTHIIKDGGSCNIRERLMALANNDTETAKQMISEQDDEVQKQFWINELVTWYEDNNETSEAIAYLETFNDEAAKNILFPLYIKISDFNTAQSLLNSYSALTDDESVAYYTLNSIIKDWASAGLAPFDMTASEEASITSIAQSTTKSAAQARSIMELVRNQKYVFVEPTDTNNARLGIIGMPELPDYFQLLNNPVSNDFAEININSFVQDNMILQIHDVTGRVVFEMELRKFMNYARLNLQPLRNGCYFISLLESGQLRETKKLLINK